MTGRKKIIFGKYSKAVFSSVTVARFANCQTLPPTDKLF
jgi:hypothetical protein